jgi:DNA (cytosine-5)-methyltransferase 1
MRILNLYAGIGGNRKNWGNNHEITSIENNKEIAGIYKDYFPADKIIIADAHKYLLNNYKNFDFIWSSPQCQSHSRVRKMQENTNNFIPVYPNMNLYQEIIFLKTHFKGKFIVENVIPYYEPLIKPNYIIDRHFFWCNFIFDKIKFCPHTNIKDIKITQYRYGFNLNKYKLTKRKDQILRNCVNPDLSNYILNFAINNKINPITKQLKLI